MRKFLLKSINILLIPSFLFSSMMVIFFKPVLVFAAFNSQINYQGKLLLTASTATVPNDSYNIEFKLYTTAATTTAVWTETRTGSDKVAITSGLFSVMLGSVTSLSSVDFNQTLYLGVNIGGTSTPSWDGEMTPRKVLGTVPAAFVSNTLQGIGPTQFLRSDTGNSTTSAGTFVSLTQSGAGNVLDLIGPGAVNIFNVLANGNIGIGSSTPSSMFAIKGRAGSTTALIDVASSSGASYFRVASGGNVGISTTTASHLFTVGGAVNITGTLNFNGLPGTAGQVLQSNAGSAPTWVGTSTLGLLGSSVTASLTNGYTPRWNGSAFLNSLHLDNGTVSGINATSATTTFNIQGSGGVNPFNVASSTGTNLFTILQNGNVGIGSSTPGSLLSVNGTTSITQAILLNNLQISSPVTGSLFVGSQAGSGATSATYSTFIGYQAGYQATGANGSNFIGSQAGYQATSSTDSNFIGTNAGYQADNVSASNFIGNSAGSGANNAFQSNFFGNTAGGQATNAFNSNFLGYYAGFQATNAYNSNFFGNGAGREATNAGNSSFFGTNTGYGAASSSNSIFIGYNSGYQDTVNNLTGDKSSILIGNYTGTGGFSNSIAIGQGTANSAVDQLNLGGVIYATGISSTTTSTATPTSGGRIGIGSSTPIATLSVKGSGATNPLAIASSTGTQLFTILQNGNVGISTTTASHLFTVGGAVNITGTLNFNGLPGTAGQVLQSNAGSAPTWVSTSTLGFLASSVTTSLSNGYIPRWNGSSFLNSLHIDNGTVSGINATTSTSTFNLKGTAGINPFNVASSTGTNLLTILQNGNVGIATSSPVAKLHISTDVAANVGLIVQGATSQSASLQQWKNVGGTKLVSISSAGNLVLDEDNLGVANMVIRSSGVSNNIKLSVGEANVVSGGYAYAIGEQNNIAGNDGGSGGFAFGYGNAITNDTGGGTFSSGIGLYNTLTGNGGGAFGNSNTLTGDNLYAFGEGITNTTSGSVMIGPSNTAKVTILSSGNVGIGTTTPANLLSVAGAVSITSLTSCLGIQTNAAGLMSCTSDERQKDIHEDFTAGLDEIIKISPKAYSWKKETENYDGGVIYNGFVAQDVQRAIPGAASIGSKGQLQINHLTITAATVNAIKELNSIINENAFISSSSILALYESLKESVTTKHVYAHGLTVDTIGSEGSEIVFANDTVFFGRPYFNSDTAGFAVIKQGASIVEISFDEDYLDQPIVNASISLMEGTTSTSTSDLLFNNNINFLIKNKNIHGFSIILNKPAPTDIDFSWIALAVKGVKTFTSRADDQPSPLVYQTIPQDVTGNILVETPTPTTVEGTSTALTDPDMTVGEDQSEVTSQVEGDSLEVTTEVTTTLPAEVTVSDLSSIPVPASEEAAEPVQETVTAPIQGEESEPATVDVGGENNPSN